jgi:hypothetical protein
MNRQFDVEALRSDERVLVSLEARSVEGGFELTTSGWRDPYRPGPRGR